MKKKSLVWIIVIVLAVILSVGLYMYHVFSSTLNSINTPLERENSEKRTEEVDISSTPPISILLMGVDERTGDAGRSDTLMYVTLNPNNNSIKMLSIPRDTRTEIIGKGTEDKINHAYAFGGIDMTIATVENFLDVPVDYYIEINMEGFQDIIDAIGGVTVENPFAFSYNGESFEEGVITLDGERALIYSQMRKDDPNGDFGRQARQRQVVQAIVKKGLSISSVAKFKDILDVVQGNVRTNLTFDEMYSIQKNYRSTVNNVEEIQIDGTGEKIDGVYYYIVSDETRSELSTILKQHLEIN